MNAQHDLLQQTVIELLQLLEQNNLSLRAGTLKNILYSELKLDFKKPVYAVLPVIFSPILFKLLHLCRQQFNFNLVMHGYDGAIDYDLSPHHPQYFMREFLKDIQSLDTSYLDSHRTFNNHQHNVVDRNPKALVFNANLNICETRYHLDTSSLDLQDEMIFSIPQDLKLNNTNEKRVKIHL